MRETSLDEFVGGAAGENADGEDDATDEDEPDEIQQNGDEPDDAEPEPEQASESELESVEPAVSTYDWTPTGADCEACGAAVDRRWRDDGQLVCADCKAW